MDKWKLLFAIITPWMQFYTTNHPWKGCICLILQMTIIGWIPAAIWSVRSLETIDSHPNTHRFLFDEKGNRRRPPSKG